MSAGLGGALLALTPMPRAARYRLRLRAPEAARAADRLADLAAPVLAVAVLAGLAASLSPRLPGGLQRLWLVGATVGLVTGLPFAFERRSLRHRLAAVTPPADPLRMSAAADDRHAAAVTALAAGDSATAARRLAAMLESDPDDVEAHRLRALAAAATGDTATARAHALRAVQLDASRWDAAADTGLVLCRRGRFAEGLRLLDRATEMEPGATPAWLAYSAGLAVAGRLRDAAGALDAAGGGRRGIR